VISIFTNDTFKNITFAQIFTVVFTTVTVQKNTTFGLLPGSHFMINFKLSAIGGDEGSRTPVRKYCNMTFSERSRYFSFRFLDAQRQASRSLSR
jgi:hypothetical protein